MPKLLRRLKILEASLVDRPANRDARVLLWKRDSEGKEGDNGMPALDETTKALIEDMQGQVGDLTKSNADLTERLAAAEKAREELAQKLENARKMKPGKQAAEPDEDENPLLKGVSPALKQLFDDLQTQVSKQGVELQKQAREREIEGAEKKITKRWPTLPFRAANFAPIYAKLEKVLEPDELLSLDRIFDSHKAFAALADKDVGSGYGAYAVDGDGGVNAWAEINAKAKELRKLYPTLSEEQAIDKALVDNPKLYERYKQEAS